MVAAPRGRLGDLDFSGYAKSIEVARRKNDVEAGSRCLVIDERVQEMLTALLVMAVELAICGDQRDRRRGMICGPVKPGFSTPSETARIKTAAIMPNRTAYSIALAPFWLRMTSTSIALHPTRNHR